MSQPDLDALVRSVAKALPVSHVETRACTLGEVTHDVALFRHEADGARYALVPGGAVSLGWDRAQPLNVDDEHRRSFAQSRSSRGAPEATIEAWLDGVLSPHREVDVAPFLVEVGAHLASWYIDPEIQEDEERSLHEVLAAGVARMDGCRLPSADEWEHACGGGSSGLFRWGNAWPLSGPLGRRRRFELHRQDNAFGVTVSWTPYQPECCGDPSHLRAGDGGRLLASGCGPVEAWTTYLTAYRFELAPVAATAYEFYEVALARRAIAIPTP